MPAIAYVDQVEGRAIDHRSDIFSLGVILYEMTTGRRPFAGDSQASLTSSILRDTPSSLDRVRADVPADLARLIARCLEKSPAHRTLSADMKNNPFDSIESAHGYVRLLASEVAAVRQGVRDDNIEAGGGRTERHLDALQLVDFKLGQLAHHLAASSRVLNDLTMLRRVLIRDPGAGVEGAQES